MPVGRPDAPAPEPEPHPVRFERLFQVSDADIDDLGHVNNVVYLRWVQDIAAAHWQAAATPEQLAGVAWVVLRHEIDYKHPALPGDQVVARTWVGKATGATWERHSEIARASDQRLLARAKSVWCPLDASTGRPRRVDAALRARFYVGEAGEAPAQQAD